MMKRITFIAITLFLGHWLSAQNVGVGTTNPQFLLDVRGRTDAQAGMLNISNASNSTGIRIISGDTVNTAKYICWSDGSALRFAFDGPFKELMRIHSNGMVGIHTQTPTVDLDVRGENRGQGAILHVGNSDKSQVIGLFGGDSITTAKYICWTDNTALRFGFDTGGFDEAMRIHDNGWVGVNTVSPKSELTIAGHVTPNSDLMYDLGSPGYRWRIVYAKEMQVDDMHITEADLDSALIRKMQIDTLVMRLTSPGGILFDNASNIGNSSQLIWQSDSNFLGVGVANPTVALDVNGDINASGNLSVDAYPTFNDRYFMGFSYTGSSISTNYFGVPVSAVVRKDAIYSHTLGDTSVIVNADGFYEITINMTAYNNTNNSLVVSECCIAVNGTCITGSSASMTHYNNGAGVLGHDNTSITIVTQLAIGDNVSIKTKKKSGTGALRLESQSNRIFIKKI
jgi:hypothetical protein